VDNAIQNATENRRPGAAQTAPSSNYRTEQKTHHRGTRRTQRRGLMRTAPLSQSLLMVVLGCDIGVIGRDGLYLSGGSLGRHDDDMSARRRCDQARYLTARSKGRGVKERPA